MNIKKPDKKNNLNYIKKIKPNNSLTESYIVSKESKSSSNNDQKPDIEINYFFNGIIFFSTILASSASLALSLLSKTSKNKKIDYANQNSITIFNGPLIEDHDLMASVYSLNKNTESTLIKPSMKGKIILENRKYTDPFYLIKISTITTKPDHIDPISGRISNLNIDLSAIISTKEKNHHEINLLTYLATEITKKREGLTDLTDEDYLYYNEILEKLYDDNNQLTIQSRALYNNKGDFVNELKSHETLITVMQQYLKKNDEQALIALTNNLLTLGNESESILTLLNSAREIDDIKKTNLVDSLLKHSILNNGQAKIYTEKNNQLFTKINQNEYIVEGFVNNIAPSKTINIVISDNQIEQIRPASVTNNYFSSLPFNLSEFKGDQLKIEIYTYHQNTKEIHSYNVVDNIYHVNTDNINVNISHNSISYEDRKYFSIYGDNIDLNDNELITLTLTDETSEKIILIDSINDKKFNLAEIDLSELNFGKINYSIQQTFKNQIELFSGEFNYSQYLDAGYFFNDFLSLEKKVIPSGSVFKVQGHTTGSIDTFQLSISDGFITDSQKIIAENKYWVSDEIDLTQFNSPTLSFSLHKENNTIPFHKKSYHEIIVEQAPINDTKESAVLLNGKKILPKIDFYSSIISDSDYDSSKTKINDFLTVNKNFYSKIKQYEHGNKIFYDSHNTNNTSTELTITTDFDFYYINQYFI